MRLWRRLPHGTYPPVTDSVQPCSREKTSPLLPGRRSRLPSTTSQPRYPDIVVHQLVQRGHPAAVLIEQAKGADLLVVGSHGRGGFIGALLGSVSQHSVHHATCPVVVVRSES